MCERQISWHHEFCGAGEIDFNQWWNTAAAYQQGATMTLQEGTGDDGDIRFAFSQVPLLSSAVRRGSGFSGCRFQSWQLQ